MMKIGVLRKGDQVLNVTPEFMQKAVDYYRDNK